MRASRPGNSERRQQCQDPDATSPAPAAQAARSNAAADISAAPPTSNSRALTSRCSRATPPPTSPASPTTHCTISGKACSTCRPPTYRCSSRCPSSSAPTSNAYREAIAEDDPDWGWDALTAVATQIDTPRQRAQLADALVRLHDQHRINRRQAAAAILDLDSHSTRFIAASLLEAVALSVGASRTPGGLTIAA